MHLALMISGAMLLACAALGLITWSANRRKLAPNSPFGIRMPATLANDEAWYAGHEAAGRWFGRGAWACFVGGLLVLVCGLQQVQPAGLNLVALPCYALVCFFVVKGVAAARRAAEKFSG